MEYGFSILMAAFSAALLLYAGLMVLFKPDLMTVPRRTIDEPKQLRMESRSVFSSFSSRSLFGSSVSPNSDIYPVSVIRLLYLSFPVSRSHFEAFS